MVVSPFSWTGFYAGINGGWASNSIASDPGNIQPDGDGFAIGGHIGFNYEFANRVVVGVEGDGDYLSLKESAPCGNPIWTCSTKQDWQATIRGRVGVAFGRFLPYATGGVAFSDFAGKTTLAGVAYPDSSTRTGWALGGGVEYAVTDHLIAGVEYIFADYGSRTMLYDGPYPDVRDQTNLVRARLSYKF